MNINHKYTKESKVQQVRASFDALSFVHNAENTIQNQINYPRKFCQCRRGSYLSVSKEGHNFHFLKDLSNEVGPGNSCEL